MKQDFLDYIEQTFAFSSQEMQDFQNALSKPLKKSLRINTNKISVDDFRNMKSALPLDKVELEGVERAWTLTPTALGKNMFYVDREDTSIALGHTLEHISGYFYVQEVAASSSPYYLSGDQKDEENYTILDMSASPGGKTTQLAEYYPNSTIIANEIDKTRLKQLYENTDRLGAKNVFVTNYDGRFFTNYPETFDKILLDAPCSGEGTAYKTDDALKYWNIKNIRRIAKLQAQLLESALIALKVGGEIVYSTCTLNRLENEEIIEHILKKYGEYVEIVHLSSKNSYIPTQHLSQFSPARREETTTECSSLFPLAGESWIEVSRGDSPFIRAWPHISGTGGFFVAKLRKKASLSSEERDGGGGIVGNEKANKKKKLQKHTQGFEKVSPTDEKEILHFLEETFALTLSGKFYTYRNEIYFTEKNIDFFWENFFLYKCGIKIGSFENGTFTPNYYLGVHFGKFSKNSLELPESEISKLLRGENIPASSPLIRGELGGVGGQGESSELQDGYYQISLENILAGLVKVKNGTMMSLLETKFMRK